MSIDRLMQVLPPPPAPSPRPAADWAEVESALGARLPDDYKQFIELYGCGSVDGFISVFSPFTSNRYRNLVRYSQEILDALRRLRDERQFPLGFALFPEENGVYPSGITDNGNELFWRFASGAFLDVVVVNSARGPEFSEYSLSMTEFLTALLKREIVVSQFPDDVPSDEPGFTSSNR